jgi:hypothetical protein
MPTHITLDFVQDKIEVLQHALFFPLSHSVLKMPIRIVRALEVDELGQIWFTIPSPYQNLSFNELAGDLHVDHIEILADTSEVNYCFYKGT